MASDVLFTNGLCGGLSDYLVGHMSFVDYAKKLPGIPSSVIIAPRYVNLSTASRVVNLSLRVFIGQYLCLVRADQHSI